MVRRSPRKHKVREHGRSKPRGGRTGVDEYDRGRGRESRTSDSAGGRAQVRMSFWEKRRARARAAKEARAEMRRVSRRESIEDLKRRAKRTLDILREEESDAFYEKSGKEKVEDTEELI